MTRECRQHESLASREEIREAIIGGGFTLARIEKLAFACGFLSSFIFLFPLRVACVWRIRGSLFAKASQQRETIAPIYEKLEGENHSPSSNLPHIRSCILSSFETARD